MMSRFSWNSGRENIHLHLAVVVKVPALVDHLVFKAVFFLSAFKKLWFTRVAAQPESNNTLSRLKCFPLLESFLVCIHANDIVDLSSVFNGLVGFNICAVVV
jgi:hypothetical protein